MISHTFRAITLIAFALVVIPFPLLVDLLFTLYTVYIDLSIPEEKLTSIYMEDYNGGMAIEEITVQRFTCERCGHRWLPRYAKMEEYIPATCASCNSPYWNKPREKIEEKERG